MIIIHSIGIYFYFALLDNAENSNIKSFLMNCFVAERIPIYEMKIFTYRSKFSSTKISLKYVQVAFLLF